MGRCPSPETNQFALYGDESDDELRALIIQLTLSSVWHPSNNRIIRMLAGLSFSSLINLVNGMNRDVCLEILASENVPIAEILPTSVERDLAEEVRFPHSPRFPHTPEI